MHLCLQLLLALGLSTAVNGAGCTALDDINCIKSAGSNHGCDRKSPDQCCKGTYKDDTDTWVCDPLLADVDMVVITEPVSQIPDDANGVDGDAPISGGIVLLTEDTPNIRGGFFHNRKRGQVIPWF